MVRMARGGWVGLIKPWPVAGLRTLPGSGATRGTDTALTRHCATGCAAAPHGTAPHGTARPRRPGHDGARRQARPLQRPGHASNRQRGPDVDRAAHPHGVLVHRQRAPAGRQRHRARHQQNPRDPHRRRVHHGQPGPRRGRRDPRQAPDGSRPRPGPGRGAASQGRRGVDQASATTSTLPPVCKQGHGEVGWGWGGWGDKHRVRSVWGACLPRSPLSTKAAW